MNSFGDIAYVPKAMSNMFMGDIDFDTNIFKLLCEIYEADPTCFKEFDSFAYMNTKVKDFRNGEIIYAWFTLNRNTTATQKWYNSEFKTESEMEELGLLNDEEPIKPVNEVQKVDVEIEDKPENKQQAVVRIANKVQKAFIEKFPIDKVQNDVNLKINLIPDPDAIKWIYSDNSTMDCAICTLSVEPDWIHFDDFEKHGLVEFWDYAFTHDERCILIFQNINQTIVKTALTPLLDVLEKNRPQLPFSNFNGCPKNLSIFGTLLHFEDKLAIPLEKDFIDKCNLQTRQSNFSKELLTELYTKD